MTKLTFHYLFEFEKREIIVEMQYKQQTVCECNTFHSHPGWYCDFIENPFFIHSIIIISQHNTTVFIDRYWY